MEGTKISADDEGKDVVNSKGEKIGIVTEVKNGAAYVHPDPGITDSIRSKLGWGDANEESYRLESRSISRISDDEVQVEH